MFLRKLLSFAVALVILVTISAPAAGKIVTFEDGNTLEVPDDAKSYCGIQLKRAMRIYCRVTVIETYKKQVPLVRSFHKPSRCGETLVEKCCHHNNQCTIETFVNYCPYRYIKRR